MTTSSKTADDELQNTTRRDLLLKIQSARQKEWEASKIFEVDAPDAPPAEGEKFFGNFPYPYMNGVLHLGHAFSLSKLEFKSAFERLRGKRVLFPQGFHCTGMPIKACADKLDREIREFGCPPVFPQEEEKAPSAEKMDAAVGGEGAKFARKKTKVASKAGKAKYQWQILEMSDIPPEEIAKFRDAGHWLDFFPKRAVVDLKAMGCGIDWRRSFITTDRNPYYDRFIQWQFRKLYKDGRIIKDKRYAIYSPLDGQPCADHDRSKGEGVQPQEYVLIKMQAQKLTGPLSALEGKGPVYLMAATLRPETMYGQTNYWVLPSADYGAYWGMDDEIYIMSERSALNLSYQEKMAEVGKLDCLLRFKGQDLIGLPVSSPNCPHEAIYGLPLLTIKMDKGTGVVTSVPSDAPDDYIALRDLKENKNKLREKYKVEDAWVMPFEVIPIIEIEGFGNTSAVTVCDELKIKNQHEVDKLAQAKEKTYLKGFTQGVMIVGEYVGQKVSEVKPLIRQKFVQNKQALLYSEPESKVLSRSGDDCVVALTDQWYITYGEDEWAKVTQECLTQLETFGSEARDKFERCLEWLEKWAVSRSYGLGTRLPWDPEYLIESLSDSTIYMAYYTIAHILQQGDMYGALSSPIPPEHVTDEVFDYVFGLTDTPKTEIDEALLRKMRREFEYWYPFDVRVSGYDLIQNHLTFTLYNHTAFWPQKYWPKAFRCNGHVLLNAKKMAKSEGNFLTLEQAIGMYSADAVRIALADAGDGMDDANFEQTAANAAILRLTKELAWVEDILASKDRLADGPPTTFFERVFENAMNVAVARSYAAYEKMQFRDALKYGCFDLMAARDTYRFSCKHVPMNRSLIERYLEVSTLLLVPFAPHTMDHIWVHLLTKSGSALTAGWPVAPEASYGLQQAASFIEDFVSSQRRNKMKLEAPPKGKKGAASERKQFKEAQILTSAKYLPWQEVALQVLLEHFNPETESFAEATVGQVVSQIQTSVSGNGKDEKQIKRFALPFTKFKMEQAQNGAGLQALQQFAPFDEAAILEELQDYLKEAIGLEKIIIRRKESPQDDGAGDIYPCNPSLAVCSRQASATAVIFSVAPPSSSASPAVMTHSFPRTVPRGPLLFVLLLCFQTATLARVLPGADACCGCSSKKEPLPLVIDTDPGCDDAAALLMTLGTGMFNILGLTTTFGNARITDTTPNALNLMAAYQHDKIPVYEGGGHTHSSVGLDVPDWIHGKNGVGDVELPEASRQVEEKSAAEFIVEVCNKYPGQVYLAFVGPLTNLADAMDLDPSLPSKWAKLVVMGGAFHVPGNIPPSLNAEANFAGDYVSASKVFETGKNIVAVGLDVTNNCPFTDEDLKEMSEAGDAAKVFTEVYAFYQNSYNTNYPEVGGAPPHDAIAILGLVRPELFEWEEGTIEVESDDGDLRGKSTITPGSNPRNHKAAKTGNFSAIIDAVKSYITDPVRTVACS